MRAQLLAWFLPLLVTQALTAATPTIVSQSGSLEVPIGAAFAAFVVAEGEDLTYQWYQDGSQLSSQTSDTILLSEVGTTAAGDYHVVVSNGQGGVSSEPVTLEVMTVPALGVSRGNRGNVSVPGHPAYYDLYLPPRYGAGGRPLPILFTSNPSGGGMVGHFRTVAEEKQWIVVGIAQSKNLQEFNGRMIYQRAVVRHALDNLLVEPKRIFMAGFSGGGWSSFSSAKRYAPVVAGVFSMGGWLGRQWDPDRDIYLPGLLAARASGDSDTGANAFIDSDRNYLQNWIAPDNIRDWSFPGGHVASPQHIQREVLDWLLSLTSTSSLTELELAREKEALWKARITAGEGWTVFEDLVFTCFNQPRTADALAAWRVMDFLFARDDLFLRDPPPDFFDFPRRPYLAVHLFHNLFSFIQQRNPSMQRSAVAAALALGDAWLTVQADPVLEAGNILRHPASTAFDAFVLENALYERGELPLTGDWDGDGRHNFGEFALGSSPLVADLRAAPDLRVGAEGVFVTLSGCRPSASVRLAAMVSPEPGSGSWTEAPSEGAQIRSDGTSVMTWRMSDPSSAPTLFSRVEASLRSDLWHDANADGIPFEYQFPGEPVDGDSPDLADARANVVAPGGAPMYLRYLTAAEIGPVENLGGSLRYHPTLAGYGGFLLHEVWMNVPGQTISSAQSAIATRPPNEIRLITSLEAPWFTSEGTGLLGDNYFERSRGYIVPSVSGDYRFSIAGDDESELRLSLNSHPEGATRIARVSGWTGYRNYTQNSAQTSATIRLIEGRSYYVEVLHKEGGGEAHCSVVWIPPGSSVRVPIPARNLRCLPAELIDID